MNQVYVPGRTLKKGKTPKVSTTPASEVSQQVSPDMQPDILLRTLTPQQVRDLPAADIAKYLAPLEPAVSSLRQKQSTSRPPVEDRDQILFKVASKEPDSQLDTPQKSSRKAKRPKKVKQPAPAAQGAAHRTGENVTHTTGEDVELELETHRDSGDVYSHSSERVEHQEPRTHGSSSSGHPRKPRKTASTSTHTKRTDSEVSDTTPVQSHKVTKDTGQKAKSSTKSRKTGDNTTQHETVKTVSSTVISSDTGDNTTVVVISARIAQKPTRGKGNTTTVWTLVIKSLSP